MKAFEKHRIQAVGTAKIVTTTVHNVVYFFAKGYRLTVFALYIFRTVNNRTNLARLKKTPKQIYSDV